MRDILRAKREPLSSSFDSSIKLIHCFHDMVSVQRLAALEPLVPIANSLTETCNKPSILLALLPDLIAKIIVGEACRQDLINLMPLFDYISRQQYILIKYVQAIGETDALSDIFSFKQIWQENQLERVLINRFITLTWMIPLDYLFYVANDFLDL